MFRVFISLLCVLGIVGCSSTAKKPPELAPDAPVAPVSVLWQTSLSRAGLGFSPAITFEGIYAATQKGKVVRIDAENGRVLWTVDTDKKLSAGPAADGSIVVVGSGEGDVIALSTEGEERWRAKVSSEIIAPPTIAEGFVVLMTADNRIFALSANDGEQKWMVPRSLPALIVRNSEGAVASRGGVFIGTAGGRLLAIDIQSGAIAWDVNVATPKGTTELERIADVTSRPIVEDDQICAGAFQGRVACFEIMRGSILWEREIPSYAGMVADHRYVYVTDDFGVVHALDKRTGVSVWKNDTVKGRFPSAPQLVGHNVAVIDYQGWLHTFSDEDGHYLGRLKTESTPPTAQPKADGDQMIWQTKDGTVFAIVPR
ncbi:MAG: outer membrane protein assembly factor BamB [Burkholderiales bacterium]|jgi:outer membrane protein assembly factor BamB|nr:outer membrane protein assembly factor BamB [Burkholderiales bacterium]